MRLFRHATLSLLLLTPFPADLAAQTASSEAPAASSRLGARQQRAANPQQPKKRAQAKAGAKAGAKTGGKKGGARAKNKEKKLLAVPPAALPTLNAIKVTSGSDYETQPAVTQNSDGDTFVAWVRYSPERQKDDVVVLTYRGGSPTQRLMGWQTVSGKPGQFIRPVIAAAGQEVWCFWTATDEHQLASIWYSRLKDGTWSTAERFLPRETRSHQNPEVIGDGKGQLALTWQVLGEKGYDIAYSTHSPQANAWAAPAVVSLGTTDDWDPVAAFDAKGQLHLAWSAFDQGDYDVYTARAGQAAPPRRISARGSYDMHPWLSPAPDGTVWISWDAVEIARHGYSGNTTITGANLKDDPTSASQAEHGENARASGIEVRVLDGDSVRVPGNPRQEIVAPEGFKIAHRGLGKLAIGANGTPWIIYRVLCQASPAWDPGSNAGYYWELHARPFRDGKWDAPVSFVESDGYLEEPAVFCGENGIQVAYSSEHRRSTTRKVEYLVRHAEAHAGDAAAAAEATTDPIEANYDHHHDFDGFLGWDGDVYLAALGGGNQAGGRAVSTGELPLESAPADSSVDTRLTRAAGRHSVDMTGQTYNLYWGDTHRHSNVSRCSVGNEPSPDDLYRYGIDINLYDFLALSDHGEHTTDFYWWKQQKTADLYNVPGFLSMLYNYEWSMGFPDGHHNAIFPTRSSIKLNGKLGAASTMPGGWEILAAGGYKAITAPHTSADPRMGTNWHAQDDRYQRVCEIFQACRGSYEHDGCPRQHKEAKNKAGFYWKALEKGYHVGIICSTDHGFGAAYACVYATTNTREAVWQAIWDRRCYGSTTYGLVVDVRSGEHWMGEEWTSAEAPKIDIYIRGSVPIRSVEIMGRSKVLHADGSIEKPLNTPEYRLTWSDPEWASLPGEQWYYVRVIQTDDEMAWSSPMWIKKPGTGGAPAVASAGVK